MVIRVTDVFFQMKWESGLKTYQRSLLCHNHVHLPPHLRPPRHCLLRSLLDSQTHHDTPTQQGESFSLWWILWGTLILVVEKIKLVHRTNNSMTWKLRCCHVSLWVMRGWSTPSAGQLTSTTSSTWTTANTSEKWTLPGGSIDQLDSPEKIQRPSVKWNQLLK